MSNSKRILIAPCALDRDLSCVTAARIMNDAVLSVYPEYETEILPLSTGGRGTLDVFAFLFGGKRFTVPALCADDRIRSVQYLMIENDVAVIEAADIVGAQFCHGRSPGGLTTYGVGSVAADAMLNGAKKLIFALGDTDRCIDGGCGIARAFGALFLTEKGKSFLPNGVTISDIYYLDRDDLCTINAICLYDTDTTLIGENGTVARYTLDVGLFPDQMPRLSENLQHLRGFFSCEPSDAVGDGICGGAGYLLRVLFGAKLKSGPELMMQTASFDEAACEADCILTALPTLGENRQTDCFLRTMLRRAGKTPVAAVGLEYTDSFSANSQKLAATEMLQSKRKKLPDSTIEKEKLLFDTTVRLLQSL